MSLVTQVNNRNVTFTYLLTMRRPNYVTHEPVDEASKMAAPNVVSWLESQKGKTKLIIDDYLFESNGKGLMAMLCKALSIKGITHTSTTSNISRI